MSIALLTAVIISIAGVCASAALGLQAASESSLFQHVTYGVFSTMLILLSHSMTMFYLIGKGKAVREAAAEAGLPRSYESAIVQLRRPVFRLGTLAMTLTMITAILGVSVDTRVLPPIVHAVLAYAAIAANLAALRAEFVALSGSARVVSDVDRALDQPPAR